MGPILSSADTMSLADGWFEITQLIVETWIRFKIFCAGEDDYTEKLYRLGFDYHVDCEYSDLLESLEEEETPRLKFQYIKDQSVIEVVDEHGELWKISTSRLTGRRCDFIISLLRQEGFAG